MTFSNCKRCKKVFAYKKIGVKKIDNFCPDCLDIMYEEITLLYTQIDANRDITLGELSDKTSISENKIKKYISIGKIPSISGYNLQF